MCGGGNGGDEESGDARRRPPPAPSRVLTCWVRSSIGYAPQLVSKFRLLSGVPILVFLGFALHTRVVASDQSAGEKSHLVQGFRIDDEGLS